MHSNFAGLKKEKREKKSYPASISDALKDTRKRAEAIFVTEMTSVQQVTQIDYSLQRGFTHKPLYCKKLSGFTLLLFPLIIFLFFFF